MDFLDTNVAIESNELHFIDTYSSPNFNDRIFYIVLHHTANNTLQQTLNIFLNKDSNVSSHFLIDKNGDTYKLVDEDKRSWHAGVSIWGKRSGLNDTSIGIEMQNSGDEEFTIEQSDATMVLCKYLVDKYQILPQNIVAHGDIAPGRKSDPSAYYKWEDLYNHLGVFPDLYHTYLTPDEEKKVIIDKNSSKDEILKVQESIVKFGYHAPLTGLYDKETAAVFHAFNSHFAYDSVFIKEEIIDNKIIENPKNSLWYAISDERLEKLLKMI